MNRFLHRVKPLPSIAVADAPARLHLGFLDPSATLGRRFAGLGLVIDGLETRVEVGPASVNEVLAEGPDGDAMRARMGRYLARLQGETGAGHPLRVVVHHCPPAHAGLGSGTQLALALGWAFAGAHGLPLDSRRIAQILGRGERSGIGIAGFDYGGLILDGGPGPGGQPAPVLARVAFPDAWRVVLVMDPDTCGLHGPDERAAIESLPPFPRERAADLCHRVLVGLLPAAVEGNFEVFAAAVGALQRSIGEYFAPAQGGSMFTSARVGRMVEWLAERHGAGVGQSSWGPTAFAFLPSQGEAERAIREARDAGICDPALIVRVATARNVGGRVRCGPEAAAKN